MTTCGLWCLKIKRETARQPPRLHKKSRKLQFGYELDRDAIFTKLLTICLEREFRVSKWHVIVIGMHGEYNEDVKIVPYHTL